MNEVHPGCDAECENFMMNPQDCEKLKAGVQKLIDQGVMIIEQMSAANKVATLEIPYDPVRVEIPYDPIPVPATTYPITLLVVMVPIPFAFDNTKAVA